MKRLALSLDSSQLHLFYECPEKWRLTIQESLQLKGAKTKPLDKGSYMHWILEHYYCGNSPKESIQFARHKCDEAKLQLEPEERRFLETRFMEYRILYSDGDMQWVKIEGKPQIEVGFSVPIVDNEYFLFTVEGKIDGIAEMQAGSDLIQLFVDHKTQSRQSNLYPKRIQFRTYSLATGLSRGMINYIGLQQKLEQGMIRREVMMFSPALIRAWNNELITQFHKAVQMITSGIFEKRYSSCEGKYGQCQFTELCEQMNPEILYIIKEAKYEKRPEWLPWSQEAGK
jgi:hypothetical protein